MQLKTTKNSAGYALGEVKHEDGSFDLTPLFVGSQGTLGIVTEITLETESYNPETTLIMAEFDDIKKAERAVMQLRGLSDLPCSLEMVDNQLLELVNRLNPNLLKGTLSQPFPKIVLFVEYDDAERQRRKLTKRAEKILHDLSQNYVTETTPEGQERLRKVRQASASVMAHAEGQLKALPIIEDGIVPPEKLEELIASVYKLFAAAKLQVAVWGHAGDGNIHLRPFLDLSQVGDRQKAFRLIDEYYKLLISLGGSTSGEHGDGRLRAPYLEQLYGQEGYALLQKVKQIFDPYNTLNPGVKVNVKLDDIKPLVRSGYTMGHLYTHMPRS